MRGSRPDGALVYGYSRVPGVPAVGAARFGAGHAPPEGWSRGHAHAHDFLVVALFERGGGRLVVDDRAWPVEAGDVFVVAPGEVVVPEPADAAAVEGWAVFFPPDVVEERSPGTFLPWRSHPLLFPFVGARAGGVQRLQVPAADRRRWSGRFDELERELRERRDGCEQAALAHLALLLVDLARLAVDVGGHLRLRDEPLVAAVFDVIERRFPEPLSLRDVADAVGLSPGHLTTVVGQRTGRTVQQWIIERRMSEARNLLARGGLPVQAVAARVGYPDAGYFIRRFRRAHGVTPLQWARAGGAG